MKFLFDLGGVFFDWDPSHFYKNIFKDINEMNFFLEEICNDFWNLQQDSGRTIIEGENELLKVYPKYKKQILMYYKNHHKMFKGTFSDSISILKNLKQLNYPCYVLSNWSAETFLGMKEKYPFLNLFDDMIISGEVKLVKPDPSIYELAIKRFKLEPKNTVFIDDKLENILAAKKLSFKTIHLINPTTIKIEIEKFLA